MFGSSSPFGQSSSSPFGSPSVFGSNPGNNNNNPFAQKPFGSTTTNLFGSPQTGSSLFGGNATGVFGATQALTSTPTFGASSTPAFGSSAFGSSSSTPAFGSSLFGQKPAFGGFGSSPNQTNPFGGSFQQSQPAFGSSLFGSTSPFGSTSQSAFGATSTPTFGATSTPAFGATNMPAFGASSTPAFGSASSTPFGNTGSAFGNSSSPVFGGSSTPAFGASSTPAFGLSSTPAFGVSSTPAFGVSSTPAFGASTTPGFGGSTTPSFGFGSTPAFGQSSSTFGSTQFGANPFGSQSSPFGAQSTSPSFGSPGFGQTSFGGQAAGSRIVPYAPTPDIDGAVGGQASGKLESISAMPAYKEKSHEELRWEDYQRGDKGGPSPAAQSTPGLSFGQPTQSSFGTSAFGQTSSNLFSSSSSSVFGSKPSAFGAPGFGSSSSSTFTSPFGSSSSSAFGATSTTPLFGSSSAPAFGASSSPSPFGASSTSAFGSSAPSIFGSGSAASSPAFGSGLNFGSTQSAGLFQSQTPAFGQTSFGQTSTFGQAVPSFGQATTPFGQTNNFNTPSTGFGGSLFSSSTPSLLNQTSPLGFGQSNLSLASGFQAAQPSNSSGAFSFGNFGQMQPAASGGFPGISSAFGQSPPGQFMPSQNAAMIQPAPVTNPFGILPAMPQIQIGRQGNTPSVQYGISSMPVVGKQIPTKISPLLTPRHISRRSRINTPSRKYHQFGASKMAFFMDDDETPATPKADAFLIPRENPRALIINPSSTSLIQKHRQLKDNPSTAENGNVSTRASAPPLPEDVPLQRLESRLIENGRGDDDLATVSGSRSADGSNSQQQKDTEDGENRRANGSVSMSGNRAGEAAIAFEYGAEIEALMPKLRNADYYTEPNIQELASREKSEPGFCKQVKDFVVGRRGYGSIRFFGETDVRRLDLESIVQFNHREVIVYMADVVKPPVGMGLNKPAEVTLHNIQCRDKKTGDVFSSGPRVDRFTKLLMKNVEQQGAEFVSYDATKGEWKFKVNHFSRYSLDSV